ncbi:MAG: MarR family winged helix-turn-helix transcriptional regulator [Stellaceae bacterium]
MEIYSTARPPPESDGVATDDRALLAWSVLRLATLVRRAASQRFRRMFGLSMLEWIVLVHLSGDTRMSLSTLSRGAGLDPQRASAAVSRLAKRALLERSSNPANRREVQVSLTARGRAVLNAIVENWLNKEFAAGLGERDLATAQLLFERLCLKAEQMLQREAKGEN